MVAANPSYEYYEGITLMCIKDIDKILLVIVFVLALKNQH